MKTMKCESGGAQWEHTLLAGEGGATEPLKHPLPLMPLRAGTRGRFWEEARRLKP